MRLTGLRPMLRTSDIEATLRFYTEVLGFTIGARSEESGWASLYKDGAALMVAIPGEHMPFDKEAFTGSLYFNTDNVNALWEQLKGKAEVLYPLGDLDYGMREFAILDNNGYVLQFGQEIAS